MAFIARARVSSEDEKKSTVEIASAANLVIVCMEPATLMESLDRPQDTVQWRLSAEVRIELSAKPHAEAELYTASLATITLPPVHHARQAVAILYWPIGPGSIGRVASLVLRWESDQARASSEVFVLATESTTGPQAGLCGLFALPFPGTTDVLRAIPPIGR